MMRNPFARRKTPVDQAIGAFDSARAEAADYAATIRDAAADIADTLNEIGPPAPKRRLPVIAAAAAAALGVAYVVRNRLGGSAPGPAAEVPGPPAAAPTATATAARTTATAPAANATPPAAGETEDPKEPQAETAEAEAAEANGEASSADEGDVAKEDEKG